ncbi:hypothetical protein D3C80_1005940 [compost metagenome]
MTNLHQVDDAPLSHVAMPAASSPLAAALDPRVDEQVVQEQMHSTVDPEVEQAGESDAKPNDNDDTNAPAAPPADVPVASDEPQVGPAVDLEQGARRHRREGE